MIEAVERLVQKTIVATLRCYKRWFSPLLPPSCRYVPTCSEFAVEAVERHGALRGMLMATQRVVRCHPLAKGGYDPVPNRDQRNCKDAACCVLPAPNR